MVINIICCFSLLQDFNKHLDSLTEHFDIPKVSWTKWITVLVSMSSQGVSRLFYTDRVLAHCQMLMEKSGVIIANSSHFRVIYLQFGLMVPGTHCFPYQWVQLQTYESRTLFLMKILQYHCILGLAEIKTLHHWDKVMSKKCRMHRQQNHWLRCVFFLILVMWKPFFVF